MNDKQVLNFIKTQKTNFMKIFNKTIILFGLLLVSGNLILGCSNDDDNIVIENSEAYFIDSNDGNDSNSGSSPEKPWKSFDNLKQITLEPGNTVNLKKGSVWNDVFQFKGSGDSANPIMIKSYGEGDKPKIAAQGKPYALLIKNQEYIEVSDLEITNLGDSHENNRKGIYVEARDFGVVNHLHFKNLEIHDVNGLHGGLPDGNFNDNKSSGGIVSVILGNNVETYFNDFLVENCHIHDVSQTGIYNTSSWEDREWPRNGGVYINQSWVPSMNIVYRNNTIEHVAGNGVIIKNAHAPLVEYNKFDYCGELTSGNSAFCFNTDYALFQFNEVSNTVTNEGDVDSGGLDSDFKTRWTTIQYNYCHSNGEGGVLVTGGPARWNTAFNYETIIRYNLFVNNGDHAIKTSGNVMNLKVYNNHIYSDLGESIDVIQHKSWDGSSRSAEYFNNIFFCNGTGGSINLGSSSGNSIHDNMFSGISENPIVNIDNNLWNIAPIYNVGSNPLVSSIENFRLSSTSPGIDAGNNNQYDAENGEGGIIEIKDIFGSNVSKGVGVDVGMEEVE